MRPESLTHMSCVSQLKDITGSIESNRGQPCTILTEVDSQSLRMWGFFYYEFIRYSKKDPKQNNFKIKGLSYLERLHITHHLSYCVEK